LNLGEPPLALLAQVGVLANRIRHSIQWSRPAENEAA
jgi:hypothetical protein